MGESRKQKEHEVACRLGLNDICRQCKMKRDEIADTKCAANATRYHPGDSVWMVITDGSDSQRVVEERCVMTCCSNIVHSDGCATKLGEHDFVGGQTN